MLGINIENLDNLIKKNNFNLDSLNGNLNALQRCLDALDTCYDGAGIHFAFDELLRQNRNIKKIPEVIQNYSDVLSNVKTSYLQQDTNFKSIFNRADIQ